MSEPTIQHKSTTTAPPGLAFEEDGEQVRLVPVHHDRAEPPEGDDTERLKLEVLLAFLRLLCQPSLTPLQVGRHAVMLLDGLHRGDFDSAAAVAARLGVSPPRLTQLWDQFERQNPVLCAIAKRAS